jgi:hypothetical protein
MYKYFTFAHHLSLKEDSVKFNNSGISPALSLAHLLHRSYPEGEVILS